MGTEILLCPFIKNISATQATKKDMYFLNYFCKIIYKCACGHFRIPGKVNNFTYW